MLVAGGLAGVATAGVTFTFDDPAPGAEFSYSSASNEITYVGANVDFVVEDDDGAADGITFPTFSAEAVFSFTGTISNLQSFTVPFVGDIVIGTVEATFEWREAGSNDLILSGNFTQGNVTLTPSGFNISANNASALEYSIGSVLEANGLAGLEFVGSEDANWTLTNTAFPASAPTSGTGDDLVLNSFTSNSAFSGSATVIPSPGSFAMLVAAMGLAIRRKR